LRGYESVHVRAGIAFAWEEPAAVGLRGYGFATPERLRMTDD
jgi:hypothetical protein